MSSLRLLFSFLKDRYNGVHFGVGINFLYYNKNVYVASRLVDSPAGRAGVQNHVQVIAIDGLNCVFETPESFSQFFLNLGSKSSYELTFKQGKELVTVHLVKEKVLKKFPTYGWYPNEHRDQLKAMEQANQFGQNNYGYEGMFWCILTEQHIHQFGITLGGVKRVFLRPYFYS